jgi:hypothetical protein
MDVLEYPFRIGFRRDPQILLHLSIPQGGQIFRLNLALDQVLFDLETQHDVEIIGQLVGFHADERRLHTVDRSVKSIDIHGAQLILEGLLQYRIEEAPKGAGAPDAIFPQAGLALVNAERDRVAQRRAVISLVEPLVVESMSAFMDAAEKAGLEFALIHAGGYAYVGRMKRGRKRMG